MNFPGSWDRRFRSAAFRRRGGGDYEDRNDESLVAEIRYGDFRLLLTGDVGKEGEEKMREAGLLAPVTVLKAAHHGSGTSSGQEFLKAVDPAFAVLSCGRENRYGHPSPEVVKALKEQGAGDPGHPGAGSRHGLDRRPYHGYFRIS